MAAEIHQLQPEDGESAPLAPGDTLLFASDGFAEQLDAEDNPFSYERLADELGAYADDPLGKAGMLQSYLFRATRLVVDTGLHSKGWSREKATDYMVATTGFARPRTQREVERYCTQIGQACSYKVGHGVWSKLRKEAERAPNFDVKQFHEVLKEGAMPLTILERRVRERMKSA